MPGHPRPCGSVPTAPERRKRPPAFRTFDLAIAGDWTLRVAAWPADGPCERVVLALGTGAGKAFTAAPSRSLSLPASALPELRRALARVDRGPNG